MGSWGICPICEAPAPKIYIDNRRETIEYVAIVNFAARIEEQIRVQFDPDRWWPQAVAEILDILHDEVKKLDERP